MMNRLWRTLGVEISLRARWLIVSCLLALCFCLFLPMFVSETSLVFFMQIFILMIFALSYNLLMGFGGMFSFGHSAFYALGAYGAALAQTKYGLSIFNSFFAGCSLAVIGGLVVGLFVVRLTAIHFSMLTLAFSQILYVSIIKFPNLTNGNNGIRGINRGELFNSSESYYYLLLFLTVITILFNRALLLSFFGRSLKAIRDNRKKAQFLGMNITRVQYVTFLISCFFAGLAGAGSAFLSHTVDPEFGSFIKTFDPLLACILGGSHAFAGPLVGTIFLKFIEWISLAWNPEIWPLVVGSILIFFTVYWPHGVVGLLQDPRFSKWMWRGVFEIIYVVQNIRLRILLKKE